MGVLPPSRIDLEKPAQTVLRVHGVGGWSSESTLQAGEVVQVTGDRLSGFYRRPGAERAGDFHNSTPTPPSPVLEAFNWGLYSTQAAIQSLWLILLPLAVVNLAGWMIPSQRDETGSFAGRVAQKVSTPGDGASHGWCGRILRVLGLCLTAELVLGAVGVSVGVIGYQCAPPSPGQADPCADAPAAPFGWVQNVASATAPWLQLPDHFPHRIAVLFLVASLILVLLWIVCYATRRRYEKKMPEAATDTPDPSFGATPEPLASRWMWRGDERLLRVALIHVGGAAAVMAFVAMMTAERNETTWHDLLPAAVGLAAVSMLVSERQAGVQVLDNSKTGRGRAAALLVGATGVVAFMISLGFVANSSIAAPQAQTMSTSFPPGWNVVFQWTLAVQVVLVGVVGAILIPVWWQRWKARGTAKDTEPFGHGLAAAGASALAVGTAAVFTTVELTGAEVVMVTHPPTETSPDGTQPPLPLLGALNLASLAFLLCLLLVVVVGVVLRLRSERQTVKDEATALMKKWTGTEELKRRRQRRIYLSLALARAVEGAVGGLLTGAALALVVGVVVLTVPAVRDAGSGWASWITGSLFVVFAAGVAFLVAELRDQNRRKAIGTLWDVATFWPRAAHPFAPPCYAERAVPELVDRLHWLAAENQGSLVGGVGPRVVLVGYSQGSPLSVAALLQLPPESRTQVSLLTCACVVRRLYARAFPAYFGPAQMDALRRSLGENGPQPRGQHWRNVWRSTDYLGGPMFSENGTVEGDYKSADPEDVNARPGDSCLPPLHRHSDFFPDPVVADQVKKLLGLVHDLPSATGRFVSAPNITA